MESSSSCWCKCSWWERVSDVSSQKDGEGSLEETKPYSLPAPLPEWPPGEGFATGTINIGDIQVVQITALEKIWSCATSTKKESGVSVYKPVGLPEGFASLGYYCQPNDKPLQGFVLAARELAASKSVDHAALTQDGLPKFSKDPALSKPVDYTLVWSSDEWKKSSSNGSGYFWLPHPRDGYRATGYVVSTTPDKPSIDEIRCVRSDLTEAYETYSLVLDISSNPQNLSFQIWNIRPRERGMLARGVSVGTFFCSTKLNPGDVSEISCLKNTNPSLHAMPNLNHVHALIKAYGPTVYFHPKEAYLPSSVSWFFKHGALLHRKGFVNCEPIDPSGSNLPSGGSNDGEFWIDLPTDVKREKLIRGNIDSSELYVNIKPALGGTFTDVAMWVFCPFNGPATLKIGLMNIPFSRIGEHVGDWEHFTLRINNFSGELQSIYFSQHSSGQWVNAYDLEYIDGNKAIVYSSRNGHASFPRPGVYLQGSTPLGIGIRNDAQKSNVFVDSSVKYKIVAAEYLGDERIQEPRWLQYMRKWGPKVVYDSKTELEKVLEVLPPRIRMSVEAVFNSLPTELYGEEGPTGPKEKDNWLGDERG